jgi:hypothetical protein
MARKKSQDALVPTETFKMKRFFRVNIVDPDGAIAGDSGWVPNYVTNTGLQNYFVYTMLGVANSRQMGYIGLGTGAAPASTDTSLPGEVMSSTKRVAIGANTGFTQRASSNSSCTLQLLATFTASFCSTASTIQNVGVFASSAENSLMCGATYATSALATNQGVNVTYQIQLG